MNTSAVFSKTSKGIAALKNRSADLSNDQYKALSLVDGSSTVQALASSNASAFGANSQDIFYAALLSLEKFGLIHVFKDHANPSIRSESHAAADFHLADDLAYPGTLRDVEAVELSPEESVLAWAEARRAAQKLATEGFFTRTDSQPVGSVKRSGRLKVLVVEDDESLADLLEMHLTHRAFLVLKAKNIPEALAAVHGDWHPDLVLLDVILPGMDDKDGFHILSQIRRNPATRDMPVIMCTSQVSDEQVMRGMTEGADAYIFKPFQWEKVYLCIQSVIRMQRK